MQGVRSLEVWKFGGLEIAVREFDLVHIHGIWSRKLHQVAAMCRKAGVPYVIAPRGMLEPWSLKQKGLKKRIARFLYQDRDLKLAAALHATAESEAEQFRKLGFKNKIIISPNGVNVPEGGLNADASHTQNFAKSDVATTPTSSATPQSAFCQGSSRRALFVSRMHPKKGVLELVESWARVKEGSRGSKGLDGWTCELVYTMNSEEERAYEQQVKERILSLGMTYVDAASCRVRRDEDVASTDFIFTGPLDDEKKWEAYARADLFVLPTYSENFGIVVAEALWAGVPVITTKGTPWKDLEGAVGGVVPNAPQSHSNETALSDDCGGLRISRPTGRCGWWIDLPPIDSLDAALREACGADAASPLKEMGRRGHELVESKYTWSAVVKAMVDGYGQIA